MQTIYWLFKVIAVGIIITWSAILAASGRAHNSMGLISRQYHSCCPYSRSHVLNKVNQQSKPLREEVRAAGYTSIFKSLWNDLMAPVNSSKP